MKRTQQQVKPGEASQPVPLSDEALQALRRERKQLWQEYESLGAKLDQQLDDLYKSFAGISTQSTPGITLPEIKS